MTRNRSGRRSYLRSFRYIYSLLFHLIVKYCRFQAIPGLRAAEVHGFERINLFQFGRGLVYSAEDKEFFSPAIGNGQIPNRGCDRMAYPSGAFFLVF